MQIHITEAGELIITGETETERYALLRWRDSWESFGCAKIIVQNNDISRDPAPPDYTYNDNLSKVEQQLCSEITSLLPSCNSQQLAEPATLPATNTEPLMPQTRQADQQDVPF